MGWDPSYYILLAGALWSACEWTSMTGMSGELHAQQEGIWTGVSLLP